MTDRLFSTDDLTRLSGCTYRQADYWTRNGVLNPTRPSNGSGSKRGYTLDEIALARAFMFLSGLGATGAVLAAVAIALGRDPWLWEGRAVVTPDGRVRPVEASEGPGWVIDLAACRGAVYDAYEAEADEAQTA